MKRPCVCQQSWHLLRFEEALAGGADRGGGRDGVSRMSCFSVNAMEVVVVATPRGSRLRAALTLNMLEADIASL